MPAVLAAIVALYYAYFGGKCASFLGYLFMTRDVLSVGSGKRYALFFTYSGLTISVFLTTRRGDLLGVLSFIISGPLVSTKCLREFWLPIFPSVLIL